MPHSRAIVMMVAYSTILLVAFGVLFGTEYLTRQEYNDFPGVAISQPATSFLNAFANWDGVWYADIVRQGYTYDPSEGSYVVFFPVYPALGWVVSKLTGMTAVPALLVVSHVCLLATVGMLLAYVRERHPLASDDVAEMAVLGLCGFPATFFFRMAYSESLFCLQVIGILYGMHRRWPLTVLALLIGLASGTRTAGVALMPCFAWHVWRQWCENGHVGFRFADFARRSIAGVGLMVLCCWGLLAYMTFLGVQFGDPLAFHTNHHHYDARGGVAWPTKLWHLVTFEPIWSVFVSARPQHWTTYEPIQNPLFVLRFINPIYFVGTCWLIVLGWRRGWLDARETLLAAGLLLIAYVTKGHDNAMQGHARYASVMIPAYISAGFLLASLPVLVRILLMMLSAALLFAYSALFAAWYIFI